MLASISMTLTLGRVILFPVTRSIDQKKTFAASEYRYGGLLLVAVCSFSRSAGIFSPMFHNSKNSQTCYAISFASMVTVVFKSRDIRQPVFASSANLANASGLAPGIKALTSRWLSVTVQP